MFISLFSIASVICFILGIKLLSRVKTAQKGNLVASVGMLFAVIATLLYVDKISLEFAVSGILLGSFIGIFLAQKVEMTKMPELVAIFNGLGGASSLLVGLSLYYGSDFKSLEEGYLFISSFISLNPLFISNIIILLFYIKNIITQNSNQKAIYVF
jgi:NAD(P) transhydrogenase subunit beta